MASGSGEGDVVEARAPRRPFGEPVGLAHEPKDVQAGDAVVHLERDEGRDPLVVEPPGDVEGCRDEGDPPRQRLRHDRLPGL